MRKGFKKEEYQFQNGLLPLQIMELIPRVEGEELKPGRQFETNATVLTVNTKTFEEQASDDFPKVNEILELLVPVVLDSKGVIEHFLGGGLCVLYPVSHGQALKAAVEISRKLEGKLGCFSGISYGNIVIGTVGTKRAFTTAALSEYIGLSEFLQSLAASYYAHILISESFKKQLGENLNGYEYRFLGYLFMKSIQKMEKIYDIYAADTKESFWLKRKTKMMFEEGVRLFTIHNYDMARKHFIEVLKANRKDSAARKYLYLCERYLEEGTRGYIYFECY